MKRDPVALPESSVSYLRPIHAIAPPPPHLCPARMDEEVLDALCKARPEATTIAARHRGHPGGQEREAGGGELSAEVPGSLHQLAGGEDGGPNLNRVMGGGGGRELVGGGGGSGLGGTAPRRGGGCLQTTFTGRMRVACQPVCPPSCLPTRPGVIPPPLTLLGPREASSCLPTLPPLHLAHGPRETPSCLGYDVLAEVGAVDALIVRAIMDSPKRWEGGGQEAWEGQGEQGPKWS